MVDQNVPHFDQDIIEQSLVAARSDSAPLHAAAVKDSMALSDGALMIAAQCISVTVNNGKVCLNLPFGIGHVCLPIPAWIPNGTAAQACLQICTKWGIPCGVKVSVSVAGHVIVSKGFGCSC